MIKLTKEQKIAYKRQVRIWADTVESHDLLPMVMVTLGPDDRYKILAPHSASVDKIIMVLKAALAAAESGNFRMEQIIEPGN
jgi:hypothetical protein